MTPAAKSSPTSTVGYRPASNAGPTTRSPPQALSCAPSTTPPRDSRLAANHPVICHHDPGPNNFVFQNDLPAALIDFDLASPGDPLEDLGYAAWTWCIASKHAEPPRQAHQVRVLADAYALPATRRQALIPAILTRQLQNADFWSQRPCADSTDRINWSHREHNFTSINRRVFEAALG
jgi:aminoglycoside phosphotransferase (APT) family kinase protein